MEIPTEKQKQSDDIRHYAAFLRFIKQGHFTVAHRCFEACAAKTRFDVVQWNAISVVRKSQN